MALRLPGNKSNLPAKADGEKLPATPQVVRPGQGPGQPDIKKITSARKPMVVGLAALMILVGGLGTWSALASIAGAVIAPGQIKVEGDRQVVQHPEGGVVGDIMVDDGDFVEAGDVLMRFDDTLLRSELAITEGQLFELIARRGRLNAERDGAEAIEFDEEVLQRAAEDPEVAELVEGQERLFEARLITMGKQVDQLHERQTQIKEQIGGAEAQLAALQVQLDLIREELADQQGLLDKGLAQASRVLSLQREEARLGGEVGGLTASIAESRGRIAEIEIDILKLTTDRREEAITTLRDLQFREIELREKRLSALETLSRLDVRAPVSGVVYGKQVHAIRAVVRPAEPIMEIVPQDTPLVIASRIASIHVDQVHVGQHATLHFSAFDQRTTPVLEGSVSKLSPDVFTDERTGQTYYSAEVVPLPGEVEKLGDLKLVPGMPVEAFIATAERTPLSYLLKPVRDYFNKAFRET